MTAFLLKKELNATVRTLAVIILIVALPLVFIFGTIRAVLATDAFLRFEYYRPGFSPDGLGFVPQEPLWGPDERMRMGGATLVWLRDGRPLSELAALRKPDNVTPLYTQSELGHMDDVQRLTNLIGRALLVLGVLCALLAAALAWRRATRSALAAALFGSGMLTLAVAGVLALLLLGGVGSNSWDTLFVGFHEAFFPQGNWQFLYSDSLIRLFPEQLWYDCAVILLGAPLTLALVSAVAGFAWRRRLAR